MSQVERHPLELEWLGRTCGSVSTVPDVFGAKTKASNTDGKTW
jgi:hypothetical protein